jgi:hypothetical protein
MVMFMLAAVQTNRCARSILWQYEYEQLKRVQATGLKKEATFGLTVVHCKEENMTWVNQQVPSHWQLSVFETCQQNVSRASIPFTNAGSEECTGYFETIIRDYESLPDINIFLQSDGLSGYSGQVKRPRDGLEFGGHTPFRTISELEQATRQKMLIEGRQFVNYGWPIEFGEVIHDNTTYSKHYLAELFAAVGRQNETRTSTRPGACFAVHRDRIRASPKSLYMMLQDRILTSDDDESHRRCCALENSWHVLFGESATLPVESSVDHLYVVARV